MDGLRFYLISQQQVGAFDMQIILHPNSLARFNCSEIHFHLLNSALWEVAKDYYFLIKYVCVARYLCLCGHLLVVAYKDTYLFYTFSIYNQVYSCSRGLPHLTGTYYSSPCHQHFQQDPLIALV